MRVCTSCKRLLKADAQRCPDDGAPAEFAETLPKGSRLGQYRIERVLGEGGMGFVYEATHETLNRRTAIKMLRPELAKLEQIVTRFLNEAKAVNVIDHQHIVNVYDYGDGFDGSVYFVMEFLEGETLDDLMHRRRPMPLPLLLHVFAQVGKALAAAHAKQIVHRDLKPGNVFVVSREDNPYFIKLLDFGIAQLRGQGAVQGLTLAGTVMGTPQYMSPEQISGGTVDARSDVWALGVMLYRAATGVAPFKGEEFVELADKILHHVPQPVGELAQVPASLSALIARCLERDIKARCQSVAEILSGLEQVKREAGLDDDAIYAAVRADAGSKAVELGMPGPPRIPTRESLAGSLPRFQGAPNVDLRRGQIPGAAPAKKRRLGMYMAVGAVVGGLGSAALVLASRGGDKKEAPPTKGSNDGVRPVDVPAPPSTPPTEVPKPDAKPSIKAAFDAGGAAKAKELAEQHLRAAIASGTLQERGYAVDGLGMARVPAGAPLLYAALKGPPDIRKKAAVALGELGLPEAAPEVRRSLEDAGDKLRLELAAVLFRLGDKDALPSVKRGLTEPAARVPAAVALAEAGDAAGREVLAEVAASPPGRAQWLLAAGGLLKLGDAGAKKLLEGELSQADPLRAVGAAEVLARAGDAKARGQLARIAKNAGHAAQGRAALALARLGEKDALAWVEQGLASQSADERKQALAICGALAEHAAPLAPAIAKAADDSDQSVSMTAEAVLLGL